MICHKSGRKTTASREGVRRARVMEAAENWALFWGRAHIKLNLLALHTFEGNQVTQEAAAHTCHSTRSKTVAASLLRRTVGGEKGERGENMYKSF